MKRWSAYIFIVLFTANALAVAMMSVWYSNDQAYFTENFCVNKKKVELKCNGRCHLKKQISGQTENNEKETISVPVLELEFTTTFFTVIQQPIVSGFIQHHFINPSVLYQAPTLSNEQHPPTV